MSAKLPGPNWTLPPGLKAEPPSESDMKALRIESIHQHAKELATLSTAVQSDLQLLQKDMLSKDLSENLKKMEKLSKTLRQEMTQ